MPGEPAPSAALYALVATGMRVFLRARFRLRIVGTENARVRPGMLIVATHRTDNDVPVVGSILFLEGGVWRSRPRMHFASRDDLFERGALAGVAPGLPRVVSRFLWRVSPAGGLARVRVHPLGRADLTTPVQALRAVPPETPLGEVLPADLRGRLDELATARGARTPTTAADALVPGFAGPLFEGRGPERLNSPMLDDFWRARGRSAALQLRRLVDLMRGGAPLVIFPEGGLSPDGAIGPLRRGAGLLARAAGDVGVLPLAPAYDPLTTGRRPHVVVAVGPRFVPARRDEENDMLGVLRRLMPLTCGQSVAHAVIAACGRGETTLSREEIARSLDEDLEQAGAEGRPVDPLLVAPASRGRRLDDAIAALASRGALTTAGGGRPALNRDGASDDAVLQWLAREYESAREDHPAPPSARGLR